MDVSSFKLTGKKILVTGHTGFKGSWLTLFLKLLGAKVYGISLPIPDSRLLYKDAKINQNLEDEYFIDIRDEKKLISALIQIAPDYTFHLAAQSLVINSYNNPVETFNVNIMGTINILDQILKLETSKGICIATTDKVYKNKNTGSSFIENDELGNLDPYSASKAAVEIVVASMVSALNKRSIPVSTVRAGNVIGGGDWAMNRLVPDVVRSLENETPLLIRYPNATRPWQHVLDCIWGYILVAEMHLSKTFKDEMSSFNFGPIKSLSVLHLIEVFEDTWGRKIEISRTEEKVPEKINLQLDSSKALNELGWGVMLDPELAIKKTAQSYKKIFDGEDSKHIMELEIKEYFKNITKIRQLK